MFGVLGFWLRQLSISPHPIQRHPQGKKHHLSCLDTFKITTKNHILAKRIASLAKRIASLTSKMASMASKSRPKTRFFSYQLLVKILYIILIKNVNIFFHISDWWPRRIRSQIHHPDIATHLTEVEDAKNNLSIDKKRNNKRY